MKTNRELQPTSSVTEDPAGDGDEDTLCTGRLIGLPLRPGMVTVGAVPKLLPVMTTIVLIGPDLGLKSAITGPTLAIVKPAARVAV